MPIAVFKFVNASLCRKAIENLISSTIHKGTATSNAKVGWRNLNNFNKLSIYKINQSTRIRLFWYEFQWHKELFILNLFRDIWKLLIKVLIYYIRFFVTLEEKKNIVRGKANWSLKGKLQISEQLEGRKDFAADSSAASENKEATPEQYPDAIHITSLD